jgi:MoxR-like ATPase
LFKIRDDYSLKQIKRIKRSLEEKYLERNDVILATLLTIIAGEHMLLLGPPGAAKSAILEDICGFVRDCVYFQWLLTKQTHPDELLGPYDQREKEYGVYKRLTKNKLPEAHIAFLDETLKAEGDTLNSLLTLLNERIFIQEGVPKKVPLISLFGASNEFPVDDDLTALYDRFLIRMEVSYIKDPQNLSKLLMGTSSCSNFAFESISLEDIRVLKQKARQVKIDEPIIRKVVRIREKLFQEGIFPSDRRLKNSLVILQASAVLNGREHVEPQDLYILRYILWTNPNQQEQVSNIIDECLK